MATSSPSSPTAHDDQLRCTMLEVHEKLLSLYSALIVAEQRTYERTHGQVGSTDELIQLLLNDPWFTWLCPLLDLLLRIDRLLDDDAFDITSSNVENLLTEVRALTRPSFEGDGFERSYYEALHRAPEVLLAHFHITAYLAGKSRVIPPVATPPSLNRSSSSLRNRRRSRYSPDKRYRPRA